MKRIVTPGERTVALEPISRYHSPCFRHMQIPNLLGLLISGPGIQKFRGVVFLMEQHSRTSQFYVPDGGNPYNPTVPASGKTSLPG